MIRTPAHKQTDPNKAPGTCSFDRYPYMKHSTAKTPEIEQYLHQYIARKQAETPKKLTFEEWWQTNQGAVALALKCRKSEDIAKHIWQRAQENK